MSEFYTLKQAAGVAKCDESALVTAIKAKRLPASKIDGVIRIATGDLQRWLREPEPLPSPEEAGDLITSVRNDIAALTRRVEELETLATATTDAAPPAADPPEPDGPGFGKKRK